MGDLLGVDDLLPELILALGVALLLGNGLAWVRHRQGKVPAEVEGATFRPGRVAFLLLVGLVLTVWGAMSLIA